MESASNIYAAYASHSSQCRATLSMPHLANTNFFLYANQTNDLETFATLDIACEVRGSVCPKCGLAPPRPPDTFLICRSFDKYGPNKGPIPDLMDLGHYLLVTEKAKQIIATLPGEMDFLPVQVVENPDRRKGMGKRRAAEFEEELARDLSVSLWRLRVRTMLPRVFAPPHNGVFPKCDCGRELLDGYYSLPNVSLEPTYEGGLFLIEHCADKYYGCDEFIGGIFADKDTCNFLQEAHLTNMNWKQAGRFFAS